MKKENRSFKMYLEDIHLAMDRIAEYIEGYTFINLSLILKLKFRLI